VKGKVQNDQLLCRVLAGLLLLIVAPRTSAATHSAPAFPRLGMLWSTAARDGTKADKWARYGIIVASPDDLGFEWEQKPFKDEAEAFQPDTLAEGRNFLAKLRAKNPDAIVLCELYFFEADVNAYPPDSPWWFRDGQGRTVQFWKGCRNMAVDNPAYIEHIVKRIEAVVKATEGRAGIFLDNLRFEPEAKAGWTSLLTQVRARCCGVPILANAGWDSDDLDWVAPLINGIMYEDSAAHTEDKNPEKFYGRIQRHWQLCREPRVGINEKFGKRADATAMRREFLRTLVYTDLFFLYADSTHGHKHSWWPEWNAPLGRALMPPVPPSPGKLARRDFAGGTVLWLPADAKTAETIKLDAPLHRLGETDLLREITLQPGAGALLLKEAGK
jgi:hypothetical protein